MRRLDRKHGDWITRSLFSSCWLVLGSGESGAHGAQKLFGWYGGYGLAGTGGFFESIGFRPGQVLRPAAAG